MRIIKQGVIPNNEKQITCGTCKTKFAYTSKDVHSDQRDGDFVQCPTCQAFIAADLGKPNLGINYARSSSNYK